jgi:hypothetical protein
MRLATLLVALLATAPAVAAAPLTESTQAVEVMTVADVRLDQSITLTEPGDSLRAVLERLTRTTKVELFADRPMCNVVVVARYTGPLRGFMAALTQLFAVDRDHPAWWFPTLAGQYRLQRPAQATRALQELRAARRAAVAQGLDQAIRDGNRWVRPLGQLTDAQRAQLYAGQPLALHASYFGGRPFLRAMLGENAPGWGDDVAVTFQVIGASPVGGGFQWTLVETMAGGASQYTTEGVRLATLCPSLAPAQQQVEWRQRFGTPVPTTGPPVRFTQPGDPPLTSALLRRTALLRIAERAQVNLLADDAEQVLDAGAFNAGEQALPALLSAACAPSYLPDHESPGSFWRKHGDVYLVRSLAWPEEE